MCPFTSPRRSEFAALAIGHLPMGVAAFLADGTLLDLNSAAVSLLGAPREQLLGNSLYDRVPLLREGEGAKRSALERRDTLDIGREVLALRPDGSCYAMLAPVVAPRKGDPLRLAFLTELSPEHARRHCRAMIEATFAIADSTDRRGLLDRICRAIIDNGLFKIAWLGRVDPANGRVVPVAVAGDDSGYLDELSVSVDVDDPEGRGPIGIAIRTGLTVLSADVTADPRLAPWRERLLTHELHSLAVVPAKMDERTVALLCVYGGRSNVFVHCDFDLLQRLVDNLAVAIRNTGHEGEVPMVAAEVGFTGTHDVLTGLPSRPLFVSRIAEALGPLAGSSNLAALLSINLDRLGLVNDALGYQVGDKVLEAVAARLKRCARTCDRVARIGGDEFALFIQGLSHPSDATGLAKRVLTSLESAYVIDGHEIFIRAEVGVALFPHDAKSADTLLAASHAALPRSRTNAAFAAGGLQLFDGDMHRRAAKRLEFDTELRHSLERSQLFLSYQPQVDLRTSRAVGVEALLRWRHPTLGVVSPVDFIPVLEDTGLIIPVGEWVLREACAQNAAWQAAGLPPLRVAVNVSPLQLRETDMAELTTRALTHTGLDPKWLELEITESAVVDRVEVTGAILARLRATGIQIAIDDFGTGYSSLAYLKRLPVNKIKIDQSFVRSAPGQTADLNLASAIVALAHGLGFTVIAEGIETAEQLEFLKAHGCDEGQGFLFNRPLLPDDLVRYLALRASELRKRRDDDP